ncbi:MAG: hypothetical protein AB7S48_12495 [Bacteroidales bacterium]
MRTKLLMLMGVIPILFAFNANAQMDIQASSDSSRFTGGFVIGGVTVDGKNFQQLSLRADVPIGKFGFGVDIQLLFDEQGNVREDDWDEWQDYLDKIYYIRYGKKKDPFYIKLGGLDYTYIGYSNIVNGYSNMLQYPTRKRYGGELSFYVPTEKYNGKPLFGGEFFFNDAKEMFVESPLNKGIVTGARVFYRPMRFLELGVSFAGDFNEYNAFKDKDGDGVPDDIDAFPDNKAYATGMDKISVDDWNYLLNDPHWGATRSEAYQNLLSSGLVPSDTTKRMADLFNLHDQTSKMYAYSFDIGIPLINQDKIKLDVYSHFTQLRGDSHTYGWGIALPGARLIIGNDNVQNFLTLKAEYRRSSKEFLFGYFNNTYELERAQFVGDSVVTKQMQLLKIQEELNGIYASAEVDLFGYIVGYAAYQDLMGSAQKHVRSVSGEIRMGETLKKMIGFADVRGYYIQNNVQDFREWKTPSTVMGINVGYNYKGAVFGIDYRWTFQDFNGDGLIRTSKESIKTISFRTAVNF